MVEYLELFQARKQVFFRTIFEAKFGVVLPPISLRACLSCLTLVGSNNLQLFLDFERFAIDGPYYFVNYTK